MTQGTSSRWFEVQPVRALSALVAVTTLELMTASTARAQPYTVLYSFCTQSNCADGVFPKSLIQASDGDFYGTTYVGGANANVICSSVAVTPGCGTVFKITASGS
jgi:hypothetical protein